MSWRRRGRIGSNGLRGYHRPMPDRKKKPPTDEPSEEYTRFERLTRALFHVDKRDVPKHEPKKRDSASLTDDQNSR